MKVVVFDLDETIGHFVQVSELDYKIRKSSGKDISKDEFYKILDMFPNVFRPNMLNIFKYLSKIKKKEKIKIMIYTNNTGCRMWVNRIKSYIEKQIGHKIFDRVICAWKYDNKILEKNRTGYDKKYLDLLRCGHLKKKDKIIFLDDSFYEKMMNPNLTYLHVIPYHYEYNNIYNKYVSSQKDIYTKKLKNKKMIRSGKKIERHIKRFIENSNKKTKNKRKNKKTKKNETLRNKEKYFKV
tara:strand:- start:7066 stop:7782 length:717 start_codon:yes stop_codon:yes gene_type:complete